MSLIKRLPANAQGRDFVVGDLHGFRGLLDELLRIVDFKPDRDRLISVGDLIDRGPDSPGCLALLDEPWFHAILGNHEVMLMDAVHSPAAVSGWIRSGGRWALDLKPERLAEIAQRLAELPLVIVVGEGEGRFNVIHAEYYGTDERLDRGELGPTEQMMACWGREIIQGNDVPNMVVSAAGMKQPGLSLTIVGHSVVKQIRRIASHAFIDTGAYLPMGKLTLLEPKTGRHWQVARHPEWLFT